MKALVLLLALLSPAPTSAQGREAAFPLPLFKDGLHTRYSSNMIPDGALSEALNVLVDEDVDGVVVARKGYAKFNGTALTDSKSVRGLWSFDDTDGTKYFIAFSSQSFFYSIGDGSWTKINSSTFSATAEFDCVQAIGRFWCANGQTVFYWDGASTKTVTGAPVGSLIDTFRNRIITTGVSGAKARLRGSGELDGEDWTIQIPGVSTTPFSIPIGGSDDGQDITCLMGAFQDVYLIGKRNSLWGLYGFGRNDFQVRELSREVGCIEDRTVREKNNCLYWLSLRGMERFCGTSIERVSDPIRDRIDTIIATAGNPRSALDTFESDFAAGSTVGAGAGAPMSTSLTPASVVPSSWSITDDATADFFLNTVSSAQAIGTDMQISTGAPFFNAGFENHSFVNWTNLNWSTVTAFAGDHRSVSAQTGNGSSIAAGTVGNRSSAIPMRMEIFEAGGSILISSVSYISGSIVLQNIMIDMSTFSAREIYIKASSVDYATYSIVSTTFTKWQNNFSYGWSANCELGGPQRCTAIFDVFEFSDGSAFSSATILSRTFDTSFSTPTYGALVATHTFAVSGSSVVFATQVSNDGITWDTLTGATDTVKLGSDQKRYLRYKVTFVQAISTQVVTLSALTLSAKTTGYFIGQCRNPGANITSWGLLQCNSTANGGSVTYAISTGTYCHEVTRSTANWVAQTNNATISIATGAFVAYRALFDLDISSENPTLHDCTINWQEGATRPPASSSVYRDRYYLAYTSSTASGATNDHLLVLDKNDKWTLFDNHDCYSLTLYERKLYCGASTSTGQVWRLDTGTDDDGSIIVSKMRTKAFNLGMPERRKKFKRLYLDLEPSPDPSQTISLTGRYTLERSTPTFSLGPVDLNEDPGSIMTSKFPFPLTGPISGRYIQIDLESIGTNNPWRLFGGRLYYSILDPE